MKILGPLLSRARKPEDARALFQSKFLGCSIFEAMTAVTTYILDDNQERLIDEAEQGRIDREAAEAEIERLNQENRDPGEQLGDNGQAILFQQPNLQGGNFETGTQTRISMFLVKSDRKVAKLVSSMQKLNVSGTTLGSPLDKDDVDYPIDFLSKIIPPSSQLGVHPKHDLSNPEQRHCTEKKMLIEMDGTEKKAFVDELQEALDELAKQRDKNQALSLKSKEHKAALQTTRDQLIKLEATLQATKGQLTEQTVEFNAAREQLIEQQAELQATRILLAEKQDELKAARDQEIEQKGEIKRQGEQLKEDRARFDAEVWATQQKFKLREDEWKRKADKAEKVMQALTREQEDERAWLERKAENLEEASHQLAAEFANIVTQHEESHYKLMTQTHKHDVQRNTEHSLAMQAFTKADNDREAQHNAKQIANTIATNEIRAELQRLGLKEAQQKFDCAQSDWEKREQQRNVERNHILNNANNNRQVQMNREQQIQMRQAQLPPLPEPEVNRKKAIAKVKQVVGKSAFNYERGPGHPNIKRDEPDDPGNTSKARVMNVYE